MNEPPNEIGQQMNLLHQAALLGQPHIIQILLAAMTPAQQLAEVTAVTQPVDNVMGAHQPTLPTDDELYADTGDTDAVPTHTPSLSKSN